MKRIFIFAGGLGLTAVVVVCSALYFYAGIYGFNVVLRRGGSIWITMSPDDRRLSESMRLALSESRPEPFAQSFVWNTIAPGFATGEMPVIANGKEVDRFLLARIDPAKFRFAVRNHPPGNREPADWLKALNAVMIINGGYFDRYGRPDTPHILEGRFEGPAKYDAKHGAFVASATKAGIQDLINADWKSALAGATDAFVSFPMLVRRGNAVQSGNDPNWLSNRSFVAQDADGNIILATTRDAFFSLQRLAAFLPRTPLGIVDALNLDGGPLACQGIQLPGFHRDFCGDWETTTEGRIVKLLSRVFGDRRWGLANVIAVMPK